MSKQIDERTVVPIGWVLSGFVTVIGITIGGCFWISTVNYRLQRIEEKLGIPPLTVAASNHGSGIANAHD